MKKLTAFLILLVLLTQSVCAASSYEAISKREYNNLNINYTNALTDTFSFLGIFSGQGSKEISSFFADDFDENKEMDTFVASCIFKKIFKKDATFKEGFTNEELFVEISKALNIKKSEKPYDDIKRFYDYGYILSENLGYYETVFSSKVTDKVYLKPHKKATAKSFFETLDIFENEIFSLRGFEILTETVIENSILNGTRTIITNDNTKFVISTSQNVLFSGYDIAKGTVCNFYIKNNSVYMIKGIDLSETESTLKISGIYKGKLYLFDEYSGKMIFSSLSQYKNNKFEYINGKYSAFNLFGNFITVNKKGAIDRNIINEMYLDKEIVFITATKDTEEFIAYVYLN